MKCVLNTLDNKSKPRKEASRLQNGSFGNKPNLFSGNYEDLTNKPNLFDGDYNNLTNKPTIPEPYTLPTASTDTLGGVKVDGETITIADGVISSAGGGSSSNVLGGNRVRNPAGDITHTITSLTINGLFFCP